MLTSSHQIWLKRVNNKDGQLCVTFGRASRHLFHMQHYAIKTIENIGSQAGAWATRFGSSEVVSYLITIWQGSKNDNIRATAASTLSRLMRHSPPLLAPTLEKYSLKPVVQGTQAL